MAIYFDKQNKKYVRVSPGSPGTWTFYKTSDLKKKGKNIRVRRDKVLPGAVDRAWFNDPQKAEIALASYAKENGWPEI